MLKNSLRGLIAIAAISLSSYLYQALIIARLAPGEYSLVMVGMGSFLMTTAIGSGVEILVVLRNARLSPPALGGLMALSGLVSSALAAAGLLPLGVPPAVILAAGASAALSISLNSALGLAQAGGHWSRFIAMALLYSGAKVAFALVCYDPVFALLIPGLAAGLAAVPGLRLPAAHRLSLRDVLRMAVKMGPIPVLANLDLWLSSYWLGPASAGYGVPALLGRPFYYVAAGLTPAARKAAASGARPAKIAALAGVPLLAAPLGLAVLVALRPYIPYPWGVFDLGLLGWAIVAQAAVGSLLLLLNGLGERLGWRWALPLVLLPLALLQPPLIQTTIALLAAVLLLGPRIRQHRTSPAGLARQKA